MGNDKKINVEVAYAEPKRQYLIELTVPSGSDVKHVLKQSGFIERHRLDLNVNRVGIFGRFVALDHLVAEGDRVEVYRPLTADPKQIRRELAAQGKTMARGKTSR
jgi:putative ubiquitin-RnfH superfamily antitoxin RatB of RatAB toxin-antitoxin module